MKAGESLSIRVGDITKGVISGIQPYGAFVQLENGCKGLIHISEISDSYVKDVHLYVHLHERVRVKVLEINDGEHIKLSLKAVSANRERFQAIRRSYIKALPRMVIGYASLAAHLDDWMEQAYRGIQEDHL